MPHHTGHRLYWWCNYHWSLSCPRIVPCTLLSVWLNMLCFQYLWPSRPKWVTLLLVHFLGTATFPKGVPCIDFGFSTESVSPVFSTSEKYTWYTHKMFISVISMCLRQATYHEGYMMNTLFVDFSKWHFLVLATLHCHNFILMTNQYYVLCCKNLKIAESISMWLISGGRVTFCLLVLQIVFGLRCCLIMSNRFS